MKKKAALELSINAIVIIIIAIVMLALALGFVRMIFGGATQKFQALISAEADPAPPTASEPITLSRSVAIIAPGESGVIKASVYNPDTSPMVDQPDSVSCAQMSWAEDNIIQFNNKSIGARATQTFDLLFTALPSAERGKAYLCQFVVSGGNYTKDFSIKIQ